MTPVLLKFFARRIGAAALLIWTALWLLVMFFELLRGGDDGLWRAALETLLKSPRLAMETLPFACAAGAALAMRRMVSDGELPALRTAGLSPARIAALQFVAALPFAAGYMFLSEVLLPGGARLNDAIQEKTSAARGLWLTSGGDYIQIGKISSGNAAVSVVIYHTGQGELTGVTRAQRATHQQGEWRLHDVTRLSRNDDALQTRRHEVLAWPLPLQPESFSVFTEPPRNLSLRGAMHAAGELAAAGQRSAPLHKTIWQRWLTLPALLLLAAAAVSCIGGSRSGRYAVSLPVLQAVLIAGAYFILRDITVQAAMITDLPLLLPLPPLALAGYIAYQIHRARRV